MLHVRNLEANFGHQRFELLIKVPYYFRQNLLNLLDFSNTLGLKLCLFEYRDHCSSNLLKSLLRSFDWCNKRLHEQIHRAIP